MPASHWHDLGIGITRGYLIWYYHNTLVPIGFVLWFCKYHDFTNIHIYIFFQILLRFQTNFANFACQSVNSLGHHLLEHKECATFYHPKCKHIKMLNSLKICFGISAVIPELPHKRTVICHCINFFHLHFSFIMLFQACAVASFSSASEMHVHMV